MRKLNAISVALITAVLSVVAYTGVAMAITPNTNTDACKIVPKNEITNILDTNKNFTYNTDGTVTAHFKVEGTDANCKKDASLAVWSAPTGKQYPLTDQKFYDGATLTNLGRGEYSLTADLPCGFWQIDLVEGPDPKGVNGTAYYGEFLSADAAHMLDTHFGNTVCNETVVEKPVEKVVTKTVTKEVPVTKTKIVTNTVAAPVSSVPNTGADAGSMLASTMGLSTSTGLAYNLIRKRKLLK